MSAGAVRLGSAERWECSACGRSLVTPRTLVPADGRCHRCRGGLANDPPAPAPAPELGEFLAAAGVPDLYRSLSQASWELEVLSLPEPPELRFPSLDLAVRDRWPEPFEGWRGEGREWLVSVSGLYGVGKTGLATAIFGEAITAGLWPAVWLDAGAWLRRQRAGFRERDGSSDRDFERVAACRLLLLDDLGAAQAFSDGASSWWRLHLAQLLRERHMWQRPTILTCSAPDLERALAALERSLPSRLDVPLQVEIRGPDLRRVQ